MAVPFLHKAVRCGSVALVNDAILAGSSVDAVNDKGWTPLQCAVYLGYDDVVKALLSHKANVHARTKLGCTPLNIATWHCGSHEIGKMLVDAGADIEAIDVNEDTPLHVAAQKGHVTMVKLLLAEGANVDAFGWQRLTPLQTAFKYNQAEVAELLCGTRARWDGKGLRYLWISIVVRQSK